MTFDPGAFTVKDAIKKLSGLSDDDLSDVYDAELSGKGRRTLLDEVTAARDSLREEPAARGVTFGKVTAVVSRKTRRSRSTS